MDAPTLTRDLAFFVVVFACVLALGAVGAPAAFRIAAAALLVLAYAAYAVRTLRARGEDLDEELHPLVLDRGRRDAPRLAVVLLQLALSLAAMVGGAHLFVEQLLHLAEAVGVAPLVLSLVIAPFATELPEKLNSVVWIREGKDTLALGNVTGAMVFQSTLPVAFALAFTPWELDGFALLAGGLALAGSAVAVVTLLRRRRLALPAVLLWLALYGTFVFAVVARA